MGIGGRDGVRPGVARARCPTDGVVVRSDAEARAVVTEARRANRSRRRSGCSAATSAARSGARGDEDRLRTGTATRVAVDVGAVLVDGRLQWFVAHLVGPPVVVAGPALRGVQRPVARPVGRGAPGPPWRRAPRGSRRRRRLGLQDRLAARSPAALSRAPASPGHQSPTGRGHPSRSRPAAAGLARRRGPSWARPSPLDPGRAGRPPGRRVTIEFELR